jgi:hypothetical protein
VNTSSIIDTTPCIILCRAFPSWLLVVTELRLTPHAIILETGIYVEVIWALVPSNCQIHVGRHEDVCLPSLGKTALGLVDGSFNVKIGNRLREWRVNWVFYTRQLRRAIDGWNNTSIQLHHSHHLGGVTLGTVRLGAAFRTAAPGVLPIPVIAPRDASTVLSVKGIVHNYQ